MPDQSTTARHRLSRSTRFIPQEHGHTSQLSGDVAMENKGSEQQFRDPESHLDLSLVGSLSPRSYLLPRQTADTFRSCQEILRFDRWLVPRRSLEGNALFGADVASSLPALISTVHIHSPDLVMAEFPTPKGQSIAYTAFQWNIVARL
jgi:hypothetical protein